MKLRPKGEVRRRPIRASAMLTEERPVNPLHQARALLPEMQKHIRSEMAKDANLVSSVLQDWWLVTIIDPEFMVPGVDIEAVKEDWLKYVVQYEQYIERGTQAKEKLDYAIWITRASATLGMLFPQLIPEIKQRIQPHIAVTLDQLSQTKFNQDELELESVLDLYKLKVFDQRLVDQVAQQHADQLIQRLRSELANLPQTVDEELKAGMFAFAMRLVYPHREMELLELSQSVAKVFDREAAKPIDQFFLQTIKTVLLAPHVEVIFPGQVKFTPPPEALIPALSLPERPVV